MADDLGTLLVIGLALLAVLAIGRQGAISGGDPIFAPADPTYGSRGVSGPMLSGPTFGGGFAPARAK